MMQFANDTLVICQDKIQSVISINCILRDSEIA